MTDDGLSGIVVRIGEKMAQLEVARFPSDDQRGPGLVVINDVVRQSHSRAFCRLRILAIFIEHFSKTSRSEKHD